MHLKSTTILPLITPLIHATSASSSNGTSPETGSGPGPAQALSQFTFANHSPNATGTVLLSGTDMHLSGSQSLSVPWLATLNISTVTHLPYTSSPATDIITNSVLSIDTLGNWVEDSNWRTTVVVFTNVSREARVDGQSDKGDCYAALGEGCVRDYMVGIAEGLLRQVGNGVGDGELVVPEPPGSCGVRISGESLIYPFNSTYANGSAYIYSSSAVHNASNTTSYHEATTRIWPIVVMQSGDGGNGSGITVTRMNCLRATTTTKGSEGIGGVPGAGMSLKAGLWAVIVAGCVGVFLM